MWENYYFFLILREYFGEKNNINIGEERSNRIKTKIKSIDETPLEKYQP